MIKRNPPPLALAAQQNVSGLLRQEETRRHPFFSEVFWHGFPPEATTPMNWGDQTAVVSPASLTGAVRSGPWWNPRAGSQSLHRPEVATFVTGFPPRRSDRFAHQFEP